MGVKGETMSEQFVTYTAEEQKLLTNLSASERILKNTLALFQKGLFQGADSLLLLEASRYIESLLNQTLEHQNNVKKEAEQRSKSNQSAQVN